MFVISCKPFTFALVACISAASWATPLWQSNAAYQVGDVVSYAGQDYRALQNHIANANWAPNRSAAFWLELGVSTQTVSPNHAPVLASENKAVTTANSSSAAPASSSLLSVQPLQPSAAATNSESTPVRTPASAQNVMPNTAAARAQTAAATPISTVAVVLCASAWTPATQYSKGSMVMFNGRNYQASAANSNQSPDQKKKAWWKFWKRKKSNSWNDVGACNSNITKPSPAPTVGLSTPTPAVTPVRVPQITPSPAITPVVTPTPAPQVSASPAPNANPAQWLSAPALGFYDTTANGQLRAVRNDLAGGLSGMVQFAQSHTINPNGNKAANMPTLVAERSALLLFTPKNTAERISVQVMINGVFKGSLEMKHPNLLPRSDYADTQGRPDVSYSRKAWSVALPWDWMQPTLALSFSDDQGQSGVLASQQIEWAAPAEMVINNIELGMLTAPPIGGHWMLSNPAAAAADYFQTIPIAKLIMAKYEAMQLDKVIVVNGTIYSVPGTSATTGDVYSGDMRENVGKAQFSTGVNLANFGIFSSQMNQSQPEIFNQRIIHHSAGAYTNGVQSHGLSGGNGMATLYSSDGNELSHELGHSYGLGHWPGADFSEPRSDEKLMKAGHHQESGWGYIAYRNAMRANLKWRSAFDPRGTDINGGAFFTQNYQNLYNYNRDAMAGGEVMSAYSRYTHHTGYSANLIQQYLNKSKNGTLARPIADLNYPSGYRSWRASDQQFVDAKVFDPSFSAAKPSKVGVPVFTLLGGYNPANPAQSLIYPAFRSNYGNVFTPSGVDPNHPNQARQCWMSVSYTSGLQELFPLASNDGVKQFNINLDEAAQPYQAQLLCRAAGITTQLGDALNIATNLAPMPPAVVIGKEQGYEALRQIEINQLDQYLQTLSSAAVPNPALAYRVLLNSWQGNLQGLSASSQSVVDRIEQQAQKVQDVEIFLNRYRTQLQAGTSSTQQALMQLLQAHKLQEHDQQWLAQGSRVTVDGGKCLRLDSSAASPKVVAVSSSACSNELSQLWFMDLRGAIHSRARPDLCIGAASPVTISDCEPDASQQEWIYEADGHLRSTTSTAYLDLNRATNQPGMYGKHNGSNQLWQGLSTSNNLLWARLSADQISLLYKVLAP